ncbi:hypothetical protein EJ07DRAFT_160721 [Lizonia empirigonia]|nr:hypothetical protein EJ07DRAFT_160721 [Lizonia empirigonia]
MNQPGNYREPERRSERANPPEGSRDVPSGREKPKRPQPQASKMWHSVITPLTTPSHTPSGGEDSSQVNAQARVLDRAIPEDLVKRLASQRSTDPKCCPLIERPTGLQFPLQARCSNRRLAGKIPWPKPNFSSHRPEDSPEGRKTRQVAAKAARMLTTPAEAVVVEPSRFAVRLTCSSHISSQQVGDDFRVAGRAAEKISEFVEINKY